MWCLCGDGSDSLAVSTRSASSRFCLLKAELPGWGVWTPNGLLPNTCGGGGGVLASRHCVPKGGGSGPLASQGHPPAAEPCPPTASSMQEETKAKEEEGVPDEEGWVKVTRRGRRPVLPRTEAASLRVLEKEKRKRARKELLNFYAWQHRETKMERKTHLRAPHTFGGREQGGLSHILHRFPRDGICPVTEALGIWVSPLDPQSARAGICRPPARRHQTAEGPEGWGYLWRVAGVSHRSPVSIADKHPAPGTFSLLV